MNSANQEKIREQRSYSVVKANELIQNSRFNLSMQEQKIILYLISKIKPEDNELQEYSFDIKEFCQICGIDGNNGKNYRSLKEAIQKLADKSMWITFAPQEHSLVRWINKAYIFEQSGHIEIRLDDQMKPYLLELQKNFTRYGLIYILAMRSQYSIRIYELLKSYENLHRKAFLLDDLKKMLACEKESYDNFNNFKIKVLDIAMGEINNLTDISVEYETKKEGKKITQIEFIIKSQKEPTERIKSFAKIENLLDNTRSKQ